MNGVMGIANAQRTISYLRILIQFVSQEQYKDVVGM
jgi:glucan 1,3-beta-glucosidase